MEADVGKSETDALETFGPVVSKEPRLTLAADKGKMESNEWESKVQLFARIALSILSLLPSFSFSVEENTLKNKEAPIFYIFLQS